MTEHAAELGTGPTLIEPVDFRKRSRPPRRTRPIGRWIVLFFLTLLVIALGTSGWYVLTARQVKLTFDPEPERVELSGPPLRFQLTEHYLLRPGTYAVDAFLEGYHPLEESFEVIRGGPGEFHFTLKELPGIVTLRCVGAEDPGAPLDGAEAHVDGASVGVTPLDELELESGVHAVRVTRERYQEAETEITVAGLGQRETYTVELRPDWADVEIASSPVSAELWIDGTAVGTTPARIEVLSGDHVLELRADKFETWRREVTIVAEQPLSLTDIVLDPAKGRVLVQTDPEGAQVMVDGEYGGLSPVEVLVAPDKELLVQVAADGYEPARRTVQVGPDEETTVSFTLTSQTGRVRFQVEPADATLFVDGTLWGAVPEEIKLPAVEHQLEFRKEGYHTVTRTVRPRPRIPERITLELAPVEAKAEVDEAARPMAANGYLFARIEPASFTMGSSRREQGRRSNETLRKVELKRPFLLGVREVTNAEFRAYSADHQSGVFEQIPLGSKDLPVVQVTWDDAARFCNWLSAQDKLPAAYVEVGGAMRAVDPMTTGYRLPTEAEWEYAARFDGTKELLKYAWGAGYPPPPKTGNFADDSAAGTLGFVIADYEDGHIGSAPVSTYDANHHGLHDMSGNVAEWCHDFYTTYAYDAKKVAVDPMGPARGEHHLVRGSSWRHASISDLRLSCRDYSNDKRDDLGFRIARYLTSAETGE